MVKHVEHGISILELSNLRNVILRNVSISKNDWIGLIEIKKESHPLEGTSFYKQMVSE
jgi:hypothetical protein